MQLISKVMPPGHFVIVVASTRDGKTAPVRLGGQSQPDTFIASYPSKIDDGGSGCEVTQEFVMNHEGRKSEAFTSKTRQHQNDYRDGEF